MNLHQLLHGTLLGTTLIFGVADAATIAQNHAYALRMDRTTAANPRATLTRDDGAFVYPGIAFERRNCRTGVDATPLPEQAQLWFLSVTAQPRPGELRIPTRGGNGCTLVGAFDFHSNDEPPIMPPPGPPGQGTLNAYPTANLVASGPLAIGGASFAWADDIDVVGPQGGEPNGHGACRFAFSYGVANLGSAASTMTLNRLSLETASGTFVHDHKQPALEPAADTQFQFDMTLPPGLSVLTLEVDQPDIVPEGAGSNTYEIPIQLTGPCN